MRHRILLAASFVYLAITDLIWVSRDSRPPFWDMAFHADAALRIVNAFKLSGWRAFAAIPFLTGYYPPLYHTSVALTWLLFGTSIAVARLANLIPVGIVLISTYGIGRTMLSRTAAATAATIVSFYPFLLWLSRETIIDYWLTAFVALAIWLLLETEQFSDLPKIVAFGIACGLGLLTKWYFPFFVILPTLWLARRHWRNAIIAALVAAAIAAYWYIPSWRSLAELLGINNAGAAAEGDPGRWSWQAIVFYIRLLASYQVLFPLFLVFLLGICLVLTKWDAKWLPILLWIVGGWLGMMLFQNKDPRYTAPLLPAIALISAVVFERKPLLISILLPFLLFQHYLVSFGIRQLPQSIVLMKGVSGPMSWDWNLYTQNYFGLWGGPAREDWKIDHVLETVGNKESQPTLGIIPDIPRFDSLAFTFYAHLRRSPVTIRRLAFYDEQAIRGSNYIVLSETPSRFAGSFEPDRDRINAYVVNHPEIFHAIDGFSLPDGQAIRLYKVQ